VTACFTETDKATGLQCYKTFHMTLTVMYSNAKN